MMINQTWKIKISIQKWFKILINWNYDETLEAAKKFIKIWNYDNFKLYENSKDL